MFFSRSLFYQLLYIYPICKTINTKKFTRSSEKVLYAGLPVFFSVFEKAPDSGLKLAKCAGKSKKSPTTHISLPLFPGAHRRGEKKSMSS
jgi:hypothetical protein